MFDRKGELVFEIIKLKETVKNKDIKKIEEYRNEYLSKLKVPKNEVYQLGSLKISSPNVTYHLLSCYLLLDIIDFFWDGRRILDIKMKNQPPLLDDLSLETKCEFKNIESCYSFLLRAGAIIRKPLHVFFLPYQSQKDYELLEFTFPDNVLIVFAKEETEESNATLESLYRGIGEFYFKSDMRKKLPLWAENYPAFLNEFVKWGKGEPSKFEKRR